MSQLLAPTDRRLNLRSDAVTRTQLKGRTYQRIIQSMLTMAMGKRNEQHPQRPTMVGLAAPQIGKRVRIIVIDLAATSGQPNFKPDLKIFINPRIIRVSEVESLGREGCYSTGEICGAVFRSNEVTVEALDQQGRQFEFISKNQFQARILQHEIDHLDGVRFPMRVRDARHLHTVTKDEFQEYRTRWESWNRLYPIKNWLKMYLGEL